METKDQIEALTGCRLTGRKAQDICERVGYRVTGVVLTADDGRACLVNQSAVRWLHGTRDLWNLLHTDSADNINAIAERDALARERLTPEVFMRVTEWLKSDPIPPASTAFQAGIERQIGYCLELDVVPMIKSARIVQARDNVAELPVGPATAAALEASK